MRLAARSRLQPSAPVIATPGSIAVRVGDDRRRWPGSNAEGQGGLAHVDAAAGLDRRRQARTWCSAGRAILRRADWSGGEVSGIDRAGRRCRRPRWSPIRRWPALRPMRRPIPSTIPNNHLSYAVQWFLFAAGGAGDLRAGGAQAACRAGRGPLTARAMEYISTRGSAPALDFEGATLAGLAVDGGLYRAARVAALHRGRDRGDGGPALCRAGRAGDGSRSWATA